MTIEMNAPGAAGTQPGRDENSNNDRSVADLDRDLAKAWRNVQARCLLAGFKADLIEGDDGRPMLVVSRWALTRSFSTPAEAQAWLARVAPAATAGVAPC